MKRRLLELLRCPACRSPLNLTVFREIQRPVVIAPPGPACTERCALRDAPVKKGLTEPSPRECAACYGREIEEGLLACRACGSLYPVLGAVPRLVRCAEQKYRVFFERYRVRIPQLPRRESPMCAARHSNPFVFDSRSNDSFGLQWANQAEGERTWFKDDALMRKEEFLYSLAVDRKELRGALIFDAGCGNGRLTASVATFGAEIVGMDLSAGIERAQAARARYAGEHEHFVHFVQGNVMELPLAHERFDIIHSSGVLHHTPSVERAFVSFLSSVRPGGRVYVQLYRRREAWIGIPNALLRGVTSHLPPRLLYRICWTAAPIHTGLVLLVARLRGEDSPIATASWGERALSLFDNYSPRYQYRYSPRQVRRMFEAAGLTEIQDTTLANEARHMVAFVACKRPKAVSKNQKN
jgi:2-polyprenyl-3-methyl-5-hydroxy-6-metoxy-1,4-benzoquinol methylase/uncharacterized protein YbaR (Trm112 family)